MTHVATREKSISGRRNRSAKAPSWDACLSHEPEAGKGESGRCWESRGSQRVAVSILSEKGSAKVGKVS